MAMGRAAMRTPRGGSGAMLGGLRRNDLSIQLIGTMLTLAFLAVALIGLVGNASLTRAVADLERQLLATGAADSAAALNAALERNLRPVEYMAKDEVIGRYAAAAPESRIPYQQRVVTLLTILQSQDPSFIDATLLGADGTPLTTKDGPFSSAERRDGLGYFRAAREGRSAITFAVIATPQGEQSLLHYAVPVRDGTGRFVGVLVLRATTEPLERLIGRPETARDGRLLLVLDEQGVVIFGDDPAGATSWRYRSLVPLTAAQQAALAQEQRFGTHAPRVEALPGDGLAAPLQAQGTTAGFDATIDGVGYYAALVPLAEIGGVRWRVAKLTPQSMLAAARGQQTRTVALIGAGLAALTVLLAFLAVRRITRPLAALTEAAERITAGDYAARVPEWRSGQFSRVGETFNVMVEQITQNTRERQTETESLQRQIVQLLDEVSRVATGDLTVQTEVGSGALGAVADSFNYMITELRGIVGRVNRASGQVGVSTDELLATTDLLSQSAEQQAARIADTSTAVEEMAVSIQQVSENAAVSARVAREARVAASAGGRAVAATVEGMGRVRGRVEETARTLGGLAVSTREIGAIVAIIRDITDQTQVLALNATIRAAAAGEHGKGFAVVAEEVRRQAQRTATASTQIEVLVRTIQTRTEEVIASMAEGTLEAGQGAAVADEAGQALARIDAISAQLAELIEAISLAAEQQARASAGIAQTMGAVSTLTTGTSAGAQQAASAITTLAALAADLGTSVAAFRLETAATPAAVPSRNRLLPPPPRTRDLAHAGR